MAEVKATVIDVSKFNVVSDYKKASSKIDGVIIRAGYRSLANTGKLMTDPAFEKHYKGFYPYLNYIGVYFFTTAIRPEEAKQEAEYCLNLIKGKSINLPIMVDTEYTNTTHSGRSDKLNKTTRTECVKAFCDYIIDHGRSVGIYASDSWFISNLDYNQIKNYYLWVASYSKAPSRVKNYVAWQYTDKFVLPGVTKPVDCSKWYVNLSTISGASDNQIPTNENGNKSSIAPCYPNIEDGMLIDAIETPLYSSSTSIKEVRKVTGSYYIWSSVVINNRIRITNSRSNVGAAGKITGWIDVNKI